MPPWRHTLNNELLVRGTEVDPLGKRNGRQSPAGLNRKGSRGARIFQRIHVCGTHQLSHRFLSCGGEGGGQGRRRYWLSLPGACMNRPRLIQDCFATLGIWFQLLSLAVGQITQSALASFKVASVMSAVKATAAGSKEISWVLDMMTPASEAWSLALSVPMPLNRADNGRAVHHSAANIHLEHP